jgi:HEPN domain-containing protein
MTPLTRQWVKKAEEDFIAAGQLLRRRKSVLPSAVCFFCQQSIEKYLKARLIEANIAFPRTHDLLQLLNLCLQVEPLWSSYAKVVDRMTDYAVTFRYPGHSATLAEARLSWKDSKSLRREIRLSLGLPN